VHEGAKLGIPYPAVASLYAQAHDIFMQLRAEHPTAAVRGAGMHREMMRCTRAMLVVNANCYSAWQERKWLVDAKHVTPFAELAFTSLIFTKHHKSAEAWAHRCVRAYARVCSFVCERVSE